MHKMQHVISEAELHNALRNNEFLLYYQPQFNVDTSKFEGLEALIRWQHPHRGLMSPATFLPVAEQSDLIVLMGEWVLNTACRQIKDWLNKGLPAMRVAVNVAERQCKHTSFASMVLGTLQEIGLDPGFLELELNENILIHDDDHSTICMLEQLSKAGIMIALDDFGAGRSNIGQLKTLPVNRIKIDKTFIDNINRSRNDAMLVTALIKLAANSNIEIVAEGVETLMQLNLLVAKECKIIQGYYFSEPLPGLEIENFLIHYQRSIN